nr:tyrosine-type recombinase/integrase [uncultured Tolumonas sp.]
MTSVFVQNDILYLDFQFKGQRCRERTGLPDSDFNRRKLEKFCKRMDAQITLGQFDFCKTFPNSTQCEYFHKIAHREQLLKAGCPSFSEFAETWYQEKQVEWRTSQRETVRNILDVHLLPYFAGMPVNHIGKTEILSFRSQITQLKGRGNKQISASRINHIMTPLRMILNEASDRFDFPPVWKQIKSMKVPRSDVMPLTLSEIERLLSVVRKDFKAYYTVRFFTGLRSSEIHGLTWRHIDFERRQILVYQAYVRGELIATKTDGSYREVQMTQRVYEALLSQYKSSDQHSSIEDFVFCSSVGTALEDRNVANRIWYPLLALLGLEKRKPYQSRHTTATLWLASGESPEWIARQLGHVSTNMLFRVYSRYVPNMTGRDGSAFEQMLAAASGK